jgi:hypothetical protein
MNDNDDTNKGYIRELIKYPGCKKPVSLDDIQKKVFGETPGNVIIELSPDYNPNTGRLETNGRPVGMFESNSSSTLDISVFKFDIKYPTKKRSDSSD